MNDPELLWHCMTCQKDVEVDIESSVFCMARFGRYVIIDVVVSCQECSAYLATASQRVDLSI